MTPRIGHKNSQYKRKTCSRRPNTTTITHYNAKRKEQKSKGIALVTCSRSTLHSFQATLGVDNGDGKREETSVPSASLEIRVSSL